MKQYPDECHFTDILKLVENPPKSRLWIPAQLTLVKEAYCATHKKMFPGFFIFSFTFLYFTDLYKYIVFICVNNVHISRLPAKSASRIHLLSALRCPLKLSKNTHNSCSLMGGPCILFSRPPLFVGHLELGSSKHLVALYNLWSFLF